MRGIVWFKKDLRIQDQIALYQACKQCEHGVIALYIIDVKSWENHHTSHRQIEFILHGLEKLRVDLEIIGIPLILKQIDHIDNIPKFILQFANQYSAKALFFNNEYEVDEKNRDHAVINLLTQQQIKVNTYDDQLILPPKLMFRKRGEYFKVFTAFKNHWYKTLQTNEKITLLPKPKVITKIQVSSSSIPKKLPHINAYINLASWPAGETEGRERLFNFAKNNLLQYDQQRDFPALDATSKLSPYLALGMVSPRECFNVALAQNSYELTTGNKGALVWMSELIWREYYRHILIAVPRVCMNKAYQIATDRLPWSYNPTLLAAWQQGKTGFPIVDAAMRQLNTIGWMHNRLRMVVAMFLSKNLFIDWRAGEKYFSQNLIDIDFASNNGGWQWSASTGTDAAPYFRIFNPTLQSERFDPEGTFIRQYCPELNALNNRDIHQPFTRNPELAKTCDYPMPIIDYVKSRERVLRAFKNIR